jgi:hypothetical protein
MVLHRMLHGALLRMLLRHVSWLGRMRLPGMLLWRGSWLYGMLLWYRTWLLGVLLLRMLLLRRVRLLGGCMPRLWCLTWLRLVPGSLLLMHGPH